MSIMMINVLQIIITVGLVFAGALYCWIRYSSDKRLNMKKSSSHIDTQSTLSEKIPHRSPRLNADYAADIVDITEEETSKISTWNDG